MHKVRYRNSLPARDSETHAQGEIQKVYLLETVRHIHKVRYTNSLPARAQGEKQL